MDSSLNLSEKINKRKNPIIKECINGFGRDIGSIDSSRNKKDISTKLNNSQKAASGLSSKTLNMKCSYASSNFKRHDDGKPQELEKLRKMKKEMTLRGNYSEVKRINKIIEFNGGEVNTKTKLKRNYFY